MENTRETTRDEREVFIYLNALRESGVTNMFGAGSYIEDEFGLSCKEAKNLLLLWMKNFNNEGDYKTIKIS